jgi:hypothetical protein
VLLLLLLLLLLMLRLRLRLLSRGRCCKRLSQQSILSRREFLPYRRAAIAGTG